MQLHFQPLIINRVIITYNVGSLTPVWPGAGGGGEAGAFYIEAAAASEREHCFVAPECWMDGGYFTAGNCADIGRAIDTVI